MDTGADAGVDATPGTDGGNAATAVNILFPPPRSWTDQTQITIRGTASADGDIDAIRINDIDAISSDEFATWQAKVALQPGINSLSLDIVDNAGDVETGVATLEVLRSQLPLDLSGIVLDSANNRVLAVSETSAQVLAIDLSTRVHTVVSDAAQGIGSGPPLLAPVALALDSANDRVLVIDDLFELDGGSKEEAPDLVMAVDLATGNRSVLVAQNDDPDDPTLAVDAGSAIVVDAAQQRALILDRGRGALLAASLANGLVTLISSASKGSGTNIALPVALALDGDRALVLDGFHDGLLSVALDELNEGDRELISGAGNSGPALDDPRGLILDSAQDRALVVSEGALIAIDLTPGATLGDRTTVSAAGSDKGPLLDDTVDLVLDSANNRVLGADDSGEVLAVALDSGDRTNVSAQRLGDGPEMAIPFGVTLDAAGDRAFVVDSSLDVLIAVDLWTPDTAANRSLVSDGATGPNAMEQPEALVVDTIKKLAYVIATDPNADNSDPDAETFSAVFAVNLESGQRDLLSNISNAGPDLTEAVGIALDSANERLVLVTDDSVLGVDLADSSQGTRATLADGSSGSSLQQTAGLALDVTAQTAYVINGFENILAVDLGDGSGANVTLTGPDLGRLRGLAIDTEREQLIATDSTLDTLWSIDLGTGDNTAVADVSTGAGPLFTTPLGVAVDSTRNVAVVVARTLQALVMVDLETKERVILSR